MIFDNLDFLHIGIILFGLIIVIFYLKFVYKNTRNFLSNIFLSISFLLILFNILGIKTTLIDNKSTALGGRVLYVLDLSKSMNTKDIIIQKQDSRLNLSKEMISNFLVNYSNNKSSLMAFAGETLEILPFTNNSGIFIKILNGLDENNIGINGTNLNGVFQKSFNYFDKKQSGTIVIFTDGGDEEIKIDKNIINGLKQDKINILLVGVGTNKGSFIPDGNDVWGNIIYKTYNGKRVLSKLNNDELSKFDSYTNINYLQIDSIKDYGKFEKNLNSLINRELLIEDENNYLYLTRFFIFFAFIFFVLFLIFDNNILGKK